MASTDESATTMTESSSINIAQNVQEVQSNIIQALKDYNLTYSVRLVAVSKTKPVSLLKQAYDEAGIRIFGENYVQELVEKVPQMPNDVTWHFIGTLQSNKVGLLLSPFLQKSDNGTSNNLNRLVLETVSTIKLAHKLDTAIANHYQHDNKNAAVNETNKDSSSPTTAETASNNKNQLKIFVQVNTSGEDSKSGVEPANVATLCQEIMAQCPNLSLQGLMTIGAPGDESCFDCLVNCRNQVQQEQQCPQMLELSMGMSDDYVTAIAKGSTNVRVGSTIFGARDYSNANKKA